MFLADSTRIPLSKLSVANKCRNYILKCGAKRGIEL
jgi:hypothetical protein